MHIFERRMFLHTCCWILVYRATTDVIQRKYVDLYSRQIHTHVHIYMYVYCSLNCACLCNWNPVFVPTASVCVHSHRRLTCWLPEATALKCVKWGNSQQWALGYESELKSECVYLDVYVFVSVTYISDIHQIHWHICWACRPPASVPAYPPPGCPWHGTVLHLLCRVMRQMDETEFQSGVKLTRCLNHNKTIITNTVQ